MRKGDKVKYIGNDELMKGKTFTVHQKSYSHILISAPVRYLGGEIHLSRAYYPISDFEKIENN